MSPEFFFESKEGIVSHKTHDHVKLEQDYDDPTPDVSFHAMIYDSRDLDLLTYLGKVITRIRSDESGTVNGMNSFDLSYVKGDRWYTNHVIKRVIYMINRSSLSK